MTPRKELGNRATNLVTTILNLRTETEIKPCKLRDLRIFERKKMPESSSSPCTCDFLCVPFLSHLVSEDNITSLGTGQKVQGERGLGG